MDFIPVQNPADQPMRERKRLDLLNEELTNTQDPTEKVALQNEITNNRPIATPAPEEDNDFIPVATDDFIPAKADNKIAKVTSGALAASDFITGGIGMIPAGITGLASLAAGQGLEQANKNIERSAEKFKLSYWLEQAGVPKEYLQNEQADHALEKLGVPGDYMGRLVQDATKNPAAAAQVKAITDFALMLLAGKIGGKVSSATIRGEFEKPPSLREEPTLPAKEPKEQLPLDLGMEPPNTPVGPETFSKAAEALHKPEGPQGELFSAENLAREDQMRTYQEAWERAVKETEVDKAWEQYKAEKGKPDPELEARYGHEEFHPTQGSVEREPIRSQRPRDRDVADEHTDRGVRPDLTKEPDLAHPVDSLSNRIRFLNERHNELSKEVLAKDTPLERRDAARKELQTTRLQLKEATEQREQSRAISSHTPRGRQRGAIDLKAMFGPKKPGKPGPTFEDTLLSKDNLTDAIYFGLYQSKTLGEFKDRLRGVSTNEAFRSAVVANAERFWEDRSRIMEEYKGSVFSRMGPASQKESVDFRPLGLMREEEGITRLNKSDDIGTLNKLLNIPQIMAQITKGNGGKVFKNVFSLGMDASNQATKKFNQMMEHGKAFADLPRRSQIAVRKVQIAFDGILNDRLRNQGLQWPTKDMLKAEGLRDSEIKAYLEETKGLDLMYELIEQAIMDFGMMPPERIPGWFPHYWTGSYRVQLSDTHGLVTIRAYATMPQAKLAARLAKKHGFSTHIDVPQAKLRESDIVTNIVQALQAFRRKSALNDAISDRIQKFDEFATRGIIREALERAGVDGFDASQGFKPDIPLTPWRAHNDRLIASYQSSMEAASRFWRNTRVVKDIRTPLLEMIKDGMFENTPNLVEAFHEYIGRTTGNTRNHLKIVDEFARAGAIRAGLPPNSFQSLVGLANRFMILAKLRLVNPAYIASNIMQPIITMADIWQIHAERLIAGEKVADPLKVMYTLLDQQVRGLTFRKQGKNMPAQMKYAKENNKLDVFQADHLDPIKQTDPIFQGTDLALDKIPRWIEKSGRTATYVAYYGYFREIMEPREAMEAAAQRIDLNMGNYNAQFTPSVYTDYGIWGKITRPFALLRNVYFGKLAMAIQTMMDGFKSGSAGKAAVGVTPFLTMLGIYTMLAGLTGNFGFQEWDAIVRAVNSYVNPDKPWRRPHEIMREHGLPNWMIFGALGDNLPGKPNIGPSLAAPGLTEVGIPATSVAHSAWDLFVEAYNYTQPTGANQQKVINALKRISPPLVNANLLDPYVAEHQGGNVPRGENFDNGYARTPEQDTVYRIWGKQSIDEVSERADLNSAAYIKKTDTEWKKTQISKAVDGILGMGPDNVGALIEGMEKANRGMSAESIVDGIKEELNRRLVDQKAKMFSDLINTKDPAQKARSAEILQKLGLL